MVFCKLSKDLKTKLESTEKTVQESIKTAQKVVNKHIENNLKAIERKKHSFSYQISKKIEEKKKIIIRHLLDKQPYTKAIMYDDAKPNLETFLSLHREYPRTIF